MHGEKKNVRYCWYHFAIKCSSRKYPHLTPTNSQWQFQGGGGGGGQKQKFLKESMELNWNFQRGGREGRGYKPKNPSIGGMDIFCNHTIFVASQALNVNHKMNLITRHKCNSQHEILTVIFLGLL